MEKIKTNKTTILTESAVRASARTLAVLAMVLFLTSCGKGEEGRSDSSAGHDHMNTNRTQVVMLDTGVQAAFDLTPIQDHIKMMEQMGVKMSHTPGTENIILLTLMKKPGNEIIKDAKVSFTIVTPDGTQITKEASLMEGGEMFHYAIDIASSVKGEYKARADVKWQGKTYTKEVSLGL